MLRLAFSVLILVPMLAVAQAVAPLPDPSEPLTQTPSAETTVAYKETQPPALDISVPQKAQETPEPVQTDDAAMMKIREVAAEMGKSAEAPTGIDSTQDNQADSAQWSPLPSTLKAVFGLAMALGLLFLLGYLAKRFGKNSPLFAGADLARVMGKLYLTPKASVHFLRTNDKILVIGVTQTSISALAEFDADSFQTLPEESEVQEGQTAAKSAENDTDAFLNQFKASLENIARAVPAEAVEEGDAEISALREDVQRLQQYLQESVREESH